MVSLPNDDKTCGWYSVLPSPKPANSLKGHHSSDYVVVGAGFAGLAAARRLAELEPSKKIILVDAQRIGEGASGRNSGFVIDLPHKMALEHPDPNHKIKLLSLNRMAIEQLKSLIEKFTIDCQWSPVGKYQGAVGDRGHKYLEHFEKLMKDLGEPYKWVDSKDLKNTLGTSHYKSAIFTPGSYLMQPAALIRGLEECLPNNVKLYENSPVISLEKRDKLWYLSTKDGSLSAPKILLCTSIFTKEFGYLKNRLLPVMTFASWTRPLTDREMRIYKGKLNWGLTPADHAGTTLRMTADRRILIRNSYMHVPKFGSNLDSTKYEYIKNEHRKAFIKRYPNLESVPFTHTWGGSYAISRNFTNFFGKLDDGLYSSACDNGVGVAWGTASGTLLADYVIGAQSDRLSDIQYVTGLPSLNPPEPFLGLGVNFRIKLAKYLSRSEL